MGYTATIATMDSQVSSYDSESLQILTSLPRWLPDQQLLHKVHRYSQGREQQKQVAEMVRKQQESKVEETQPHRAWLVEHF
ncbi:hypothetical protein HPB47_018435 [Ixodes persulcatus]|uniref:Uncharacterized protein n=2 Tax=Ixodes persulcatus TaxID=34615 RepID=A0AC60QKR5_IXOPE|nr:hypothetical protein HPB47_002597 [Ixodes persulcatus]KAG0435524.1 hypothetical protein HPB47_018435 [Ixodes persulcatus]